MEFTLDVNQYLDRIGYDGEVSVSVECLKNLHRHHVISVPFEATDIHFGQRIKLDLEHIYDKVVIRRRGGFCYELNYLFRTLLQQLGFTTKIISAQVYNERSYGPAFDHLSIVVDLNGLWLLDVGFGDLFLAPIEIRPGLIQADRDSDFLLDELGAETFSLLAARSGEDEFVPKYRFSLRARCIEDFAEQCRFKQESPTSHFVQNIICTLPTKEGRKTIKNNVFRIRREGTLTEQTISSDAELRSILVDHFGFL